MRLLLIYKELVRKGNYEVARKLLKFMKDGNAKLYFGDIDWEASTILEKCGYKPSVDRRGIATFRMKFDIGYGCLGNGTTVWNRLQEVNDYKTVAHIDDNGNVKFYDYLPKRIREEILKFVKERGMI